MGTGCSIHFAANTEVGTSTWNSGVAGKARQLWHARWPRSAVISAQPSTCARRHWGPVVDDTAIRTWLGPRMQGNPLCELVDWWVADF